MPDPTPAQRLQLTLPPFRLRPHVPRPPSLRLGPPVPAAGHDVRSFPFLPPLDLAPPLEREPASSFDPFRRWPLPAVEPDPSMPTEPLQLKQPEPLAMYNFNQTYQADEPANRGTAEALLGFSRTAGQNQYGSTLLGRQSWNHGALGLTMSGDSGLGLRSIGAVGHLWRSVSEGVTIGAYGQGTLGSIPAPLGAVGSNTGTGTVAGSFDWGWLSLDLNAIGSAANRVQLNDPAQSIVGPAYGLGGSAALTRKWNDGYSGIMAEGFYGHQWITGDPAGAVNRYGFGVGGFRNFRVGERGVFFAGLYGNASWEAGQLTPRGGAASSYNTPTLGLSLILGWGR